MKIKSPGKIKKLLYEIKRPLYNIKKYCYCKFFHKRWLCYPEVWDRGLKGPWHCSKCHPCGEGLEKILKIAEKK